MKGSFLSKLVLGLITSIGLLGLGQAQAVSNVIVDGNLNEWTVFEKLNLSTNQAPAGYELYGDLAASTYYFALKTGGTVLGPNTTIWLNTDQNTQTGFLIFGGYGGAEFNINFDATGVPSLYSDGAGGTLVSALTYRFDTTKTQVEIAVPASLLPAGTKDIDVLFDINDQTYIPADYSNIPFTLTTINFPTRTNMAKRVAVVFATKTADNFFNRKAYSQLYMSLQHQVMMAGVPFDVIYTDKLTNIANLVNYDALIFPYAANISRADLKVVYNTLMQASYLYKIGILTAGDLLTNDELNVPLSGNAYTYMSNIIGLQRIDGSGPVNLTVQAQNVSHPAMRGYQEAELLFSYTNTFYGVYASPNNQPVTVLATQTINSTTTYPAISATITGGRNIHFSTIQLLGDGNQAWQALQWMLYGDQTPVALKLGRYQNIVLSRNDTDDAMDAEQVPIEHTALLNLITQWNTKYNFIGSYYIDIGNDVPNGFYTNWTVSAPLFQKYIALGNEIGTHSYTHPPIVDALTPAQWDFEFKQSKLVIEQNLKLQNIGMAYPGNPENMPVNEYLRTTFPYLSGGYSGVGAGYPGAMGYLTPDFKSEYFSPSMYFDFTMIEFLHWSATQAEQFWAQQYRQLTNHAAQPIIVWPWHDYAPTVSLPLGYSIPMFENTLDMAFKARAEFITLKEAALRIQSFNKSSLTVTYPATNQIKAVVATTGTQLNKGALWLNIPNTQVIKNVQNWYAYNKNMVFMPSAGGTFNIALGSSQDVVTRIVDMPVRSQLTSVSGNGTNLSFQFVGKGVLTVELKSATSYISVLGADAIRRTGSKLELYYKNDGSHITVIYVGAGWIAQNYSSFTSKINPGYFLPTSASLTANSTNLLSARTGGGTVSDEEYKFGVVNSGEVIVGSGFYPDGSTVPMMMETSHQHSDTPTSPTVVDPLVVTPTADISASPTVPAQSDRMSTPVDVPTEMPIIIPTATAVSAPTEIPVVVTIAPIDVSKPLLEQLPPVTSVQTEPPLPTQIVPVDASKFLLEQFPPLVTQDVPNNSGIAPIVVDPKTNTVIGQP